MIKLIDVYGDEWELNPKLIAGFVYSKEEVGIPNPETPYGFIFVGAHTTVYIGDDKTYFEGDIREQLR